MSCEGVKPHNLNDKHGCCAVPQGKTGSHDTGPLNDSKEGEHKSAGECSHERNPEQHHGPKRHRHAEPFILAEERALHGSEEEERNAPDDQM